MYKHTQFLRAHFFHYAVEHLCQVEVAVLCEETFQIDVEGVEVNIAIVHATVYSREHFVQTSFQLVVGFETGYLKRVTHIFHKGVIDVPGYFVRRTVVV